MKFLAQSFITSLGGDPIPLNSPGAAAKAAAAGLQKVKKNKQNEASDDKCHRGISKGVRNL